MRIEEILQFMEGPEDGTFAGVRFYDQSAKELKEFSDANNIPNQTPIEDYHITLLFSKVPLPGYEPHQFYKKALMALPKDVKIWGEDKEKALVLILDCPDLVKRHNYLMSQFPEATWDHPEYIPHVTLSYDVGDFDPSTLDIKQIGLLTLVGEYSDDIEPDWEKDL